MVGREKLPYGIPRAECLVSEEDAAQILGGKLFEDAGIGSGPLGKESIVRTVEQEIQPGGFDLAHGDGLDKEIDGGDVQPLLRHPHREDAGPAAHVQGPAPPTPATV